LTSKQFEILNGLPPTGPMYVPVTTDGQPFYSEGFVVRFFKSDGSDWVANFQPGFGGHSGVYDLAEPNKFAVFAKGTCYIMTTEDSKPLETLGGSFQQVLINKTRQLILIDVTDISVIEPTGQHWNSERISWDGFKDIKLIENVISGLSFDPMDRENEWISFTFDILTKEINGGSFRRYKFSPVGPNVKKIERKDKEDKPWWKFWV
jgi:hypothetical protein